MNRRIALALLLTWSSSAYAAQRLWRHCLYDSYDHAIARVRSMVRDAESQRLAQQHGLQILDVQWEDTGRLQGSSVGPNISDVTIEISDDYGGTFLIPVIRFPNFTDKTADVRLDKFFIRVGNESAQGREQVISLEEFLGDPAPFMSFPNAGRIKGGSLLAPRDTHALVSAQAAFLPVPGGGKAQFHPVIFNYQSTAKDPAVLTILITRQGTSMTVIDNARHTVSGGASRGQRLFFNASGQRAPLTAERLSDVQSNGATSNGETASSLGEDANLLMLVQVPLKHREPPRPSWMPFFGLGAVPPAAAVTDSLARERDMEVAVLGHGEIEGPYTELDGLTIERDPRFPVRVTVQFYQAISAANIGAANMEKLARQISHVYEKGDYVGSLVAPDPADLERPTNWDGVSARPANVSWWDFPGLVERFFKHGNERPHAAGRR